MRFNRKARAAMEFLMTYGWAILVVLVVIGALAYFGVLSPTALLPEKCFLPIGLDCEQHLVDTDGATLKIRNGLGDTITITEMSITSDLDWTCTKAAENIVIQNGKSMTIPLRTGCAGGTAPSEDDKAKFVIDVVYYKGGSATFTHSLEGELLSRVEAPVAAAAQCADTIDNDGDTLIDFGADPECADAADDDEAV